jgi:hypothetical protein
MGVNIIEVSTGKNTITEVGKMEIFDALIQAKKENINKLASTVPGMIRFLEGGGWLGTVPRGYSQTGPRAKTKEKFSEKQVI